MGTPVSKEYIIINFSWEGPTSLNGGVSAKGTEVETIKLIFAEAANAFHVDIDPSKEQPFPFTVQKYSEKPTFGKDMLEGMLMYRPCLETEKHKVLKIALDKIPNLKIVATMAKQSDLPGKLSFDDMNFLCRRKRIVAVDREVLFETPEQLEPGKRYTLRISSPNLSACLIEDQTAIPQNNLKSAEKKTEQQPTPIALPPETTFAQLPARISQLPTNDLCYLYKQFSIKKIEYEAKLKVANRSQNLKMKQTYERHVVAYNNLLILLNTALAERKLTIEQVILNEIAGQ